MRSLLVAWLVALAACGAPPLPAYDTTIGVRAIPVPPGALAGTFALYVEAATQVDVPIPGVGKQPGGGDSWFLVTRTFDAQTGYHETHKLCGGRIWDVLGTKTTISDAARRKVPAEAVRSVTVSPAGDYALDGHLELWGLAGIPDAYTADLPADAAGWQQAPAKAWVVDMDGDGHPGFTAHVSGTFATGDVYFVQRRRINLEGITRGADRVFGLDFSDALKVTIGATSGLLASPTPVYADPNPRLSWFDETRLPDGATCDDVAKVVADGVIGKVRPF